MKEINVKGCPGVILVLSLLFITLAFNGCDSLKTSIQGDKPPVIETVVKPDFDNIKGSSIGIFNFNNCDNSDKLGLAFAEFTRKYFLEHKFMKLIDLAGIMPEGIKDAVEIGRNMGYDLILLGSLNEFFYGGLSADSRVAVSVRVIDVRTESLIGHISGSMEGRHKDRFDYIFYKKESSEAPSPNLLAAKVMQEILNSLIQPSVPPEKKS